VIKNERCCINGTKSIMGLPIRFRNINYYRIADKYIFSGDLFITRGTIYYFPEVDLDEQERKSLT
jgi:hypothetical protein